MKKIVVLFFCAVLAVGAEVRLNGLFDNSMVLQRETTVPIWGTADAGEEILVEFAGQRKTTVADSDGKWMVRLDPLETSKSPRELTVASARNQKLKIGDVMVGDVWLCSGQSNMKSVLKNSDAGEILVDQAENPLLRLFKTPQRIGRIPQTDVDAAWSASSPETAAPFSAVAYVFGRRVQKETGIPIGLLQCSVGSTAVECWVSNETLARAPFDATTTPWRELESNWSDPAVREKYLHKSVKGKKNIQPWDARTYPAGAFNGMLHPLAPFAVKGVIWYQGEANRERGHQYKTLFPAMVAEWRALFENPALPFYIVQLPELKKSSAVPSASRFAELREAQALAAKADPQMEMAVIIDTNKGGNIHPTNKLLPGERLAAIALAKQYGKPIEYAGPTFESMQVEGQRIRIRYSHASGGLICATRPDNATTEVEPCQDKPTNFAVAGTDGKFYNAEAEIDGETVLVHAKKVPHPVAVRYAWADNPEGCNLYNKAGFPAAPFRTDDGKWISKGRLSRKPLVVE